MKRIANIASKNDLRTADRRVPFVWVVAAAFCMTVIASSGCDMGTYNKRLKERHSNAPSDVESADDENDEDQSP